MMWVRLLSHVTDVQIRRARKIGLEGHADQSTFPRAIDGQRQHWRSQQLTVLNYTKRPCLFANKNAAVAKRLHSGAAGEACRDRADLKAGGKSDGAGDARPGRGLATGAQRL